MKPMMFNADMIRAIREECRKTVTRRVIKPQPPATSHVARVRYSWAWSWWTDGDAHHFAPPYHPGEIVYVPEAWRLLDMWNTPDLRKVCARVQFRDGDGVRFPFYDKERAEKWRKYLDKPKDKWQSPYFMPREAARLFLQIKDVRVERLQTPFFEIIDKPITELKKEGMLLLEECEACLGCYGRPACISRDGNELSECGLLDETRGEFSDLWDSTIKPKDREQFCWSANPWVWVIEFERIGKEEAKA